MVSPLLQNIKPELESVVFFGTDGGCLDAYFLANEQYTIGVSIFLGDRRLEQVFPNSKHLGGFDRSVDFPEVPFVYQCGNHLNFEYRHLWFERARKFRLKPLSCLSKFAYLHPTSTIGQGSIIYPGAKVMANTKIGKNVIILPNVVINHDSVIGDYSIVNSGAILSGGVQVGYSCYLGSGCLIREGVVIHPNTLVGMGSLVLDNLTEPGVYFGSPARQQFL